MSAIARYFINRGLVVAGYDKTPSALTLQLEKEGMLIHYEEDVEQIPLACRDKEHCLVIYTPAIPNEHAELQFFRNGGFDIQKRAQVLGTLTKSLKGLCFAGTHGKTTTSTMCAHIMHQSSMDCNAFLGGISKNYGTNLLMSENDVVVAEADEFDRSFLQLHPDIAVITAMDADHLDIYGDLAHVQEAFRQFASQVKDTLILKYGLPVSGKDTSAKILSYHYDDKAADFHAENMQIDGLGHFIYDLHHPGGVISGIRVGTLGRVNVENSVAAAAICLCHGVAPEAIRKAIGTFQGAQRRLDEHVNTASLTYIDDYAHHPAELATAISSIREIFPGRKLTGIFQPHLYTRTRDFAPEFAQALSGLDKVILLDIYPAREEPIPGVSSEIIFKDITAPEKILLTKEELMPYLEKEPVDVLVTFGAGNIDRFIEPIKQMLLAR